MNETHHNKTIEKNSFEESLERLEEVVRLLEKGDAPLDEAIKLFDEGMNLAHVCNNKLEAAEQQIEILVQEKGSWMKKSLMEDE
jgi:exodeoxyribonuclease VII small subunit